MEEDVVIIIISCVKTNCHVTCEQDNDLYRHVQN